MFGERNSFAPPRSQGRGLVKNTVNSNVISQYDYAHDALGRRVSAAKSGTMMTASKNLAYGYNDRSELVSAVSDVDANYNYAYAFDHIGNRATETVAMANSESRISNYSTNNLNQYTEISLGEAVSSPLQYDADGNATQVQTSTGTRSITYNAENRPVRFENAGTQTNPGLIEEKIPASKSFLEKIVGLAIRIAG